MIKKRCFFDLLVLFFLVFLFWVWWIWGSVLVCVVCGKIWVDFWVWVCILCSSSVWRFGKNSFTIRRRELCSNLRNDWRVIFEFFWNVWVYIFVDLCLLCFCLCGFICILWVWFCTSLTSTNSGWTSTLRWCFFFYFRMNFVWEFWCVVCNFVVVIESFCLVVCEFILMVWDCLSSCVSGVLTVNLLSCGCFIEAVLRRNGFFLFEGCLVVKCCICNL